MYLQHFQLSQMPFGLTPDTAFFVPLEQHEDVLAVLKTALCAGEGFIKVCGEVGSGKTLLCRKLLQHTEPDWQLAYIPDPCLTPLELRWALALELGLKHSANIEPPQLLQLLQLLRQSAQAWRIPAPCRPILIWTSISIWTCLKTHWRKHLQRPLAILQRWRLPVCNRTAFPQKIRQKPGLPPNLKQRPIP